MSAPVCVPVCVCVCECEGARIEIKTRNRKVMHKWGGVGSNAGTASKLRGGLPSFEMPAFFGGAAGVEALDKDTSRHKKPLKKRCVEQVCAAGVCNVG